MCMIYLNIQYIKLFAFNIIHNYYIMVISIHIIILFIFYLRGSMQIS